MASHSGSRKRARVSQTEEASAHTDISTSASSSKSAREMAANHSTAAPPPNHHEQHLKTLNTDIDAMRQLVTCKICDRLLYEPYSLACGHTYCYSCLSQWLVSNRKKTCPDCRAVITQQPTPSYIIRELVLIFVSRNELLPDGETTEEHHTLARQEGKIVADDRANTDPATGGLFKGCFSWRGARPMPIYDPGDGVDRCPHCHWELEDGICEHCGYDLALHSPGGFTDDLSDDSSDAVWGLDGHDHDHFFGQDDFDGDNSTVADGDIIDGTAHRNPNRPRRPRVVDLRSNDGYNSADDDLNDPDLYGFVVDDDQIEPATSDDDGESTDVIEIVGSRRMPGRSRRAERRPHVISSDDDEETPTPTPWSPDPASVNHGSDDDDETTRPWAANPGPFIYDSDEDDDGPVIRGSQRAQRGHVPIRPRRDHFAEDQSSNDGAGDHESSLDGHDGFSSLDGSVGDTVSQRTENDSDDQSRSSSVYPMYGDDEESEEESEESDGEDGWDEAPRAARHTQPSQPHPLSVLGRQQNNRLPDPLRIYPGVFHGQPTVRSSRPDYDRFERYPVQRPGTHGQTPPFGILRPPTHPFQLGNTLAGINFNQRNQQLRSHRDERTASVGSSRSSHGGGVGVQLQSQSSGWNGSSATLRAGARERRKRALSISSDVSYSDTARV